MPEPWWRRLLPGSRSYAPSDIPAPDDIPVPRIVPAGRGGGRRVTRRDTSPPPVPEEPYLPDLSPLPLPQDPVPIIDPRCLFPEALGIEWGWTYEQCRSRLISAKGDPERPFLDLVIQVGSEEVGASIGFWGGPPTGNNRRSELDVFQSVQVWLPLPLEIDPEEFMEEALETSPESKAEWEAVVSEFERRQQSVHAYFRNVKAQYLELLGPTPLQANEVEIGDFCLQTKEAVGWRLPQANVALMVLAEDCSDWGFKSVFLEITPPESRGFFFDGWRPRK